MFRSVNTKIVAAFIVVLIVALSAALVVNYNRIRQHEHELSDSMGLAAAKQVSAVVENSYDYGSGGDFVPGTADYDTCLALLRELCQTSGMNYLYVCEYDVENSTITYLMAVGASDAENETISRERSYGTVVRTDIDDVELQALAGEEVSQALELDNQFGNQLDWYYPVEDLGDNILAGASYSVSQQRKRETVETLNVMVPFVVAFLLLLAVEIAILRKSVFNPLRVIAGRMRAFSAESADAPEPLGITSKDEIGDIAEAFEEMASDIGTYTSRIEHLAAERAQAQFALDVSRRIQQGMVPERTEKAGEGYSACGFSRPARSVGGDFYDVVELEDGRIAVVVGDVAGKGMAAALFMSMVKTMIRDGLLAGDGPAKVLNHTNARIEQENPEGMFVTVFACILDPATGEARYANAGHMPPLLADDRVCALPVDPGDLLGLFEDFAVREDTVVLERGQGLLVYTDGMVEARQADGSFFGEQRFADALGAQAPFGGAGDLADAAIRAVDGFSAGQEQFDDLTVAAIVFDGTAEGEVSDSLELLAACELPCDMASFTTLREALLAADVDDALKHKACLACEEAFVNIASYSNASRIWAEASLDCGQLQVTLADDGIPFDPLAASPADKDFEDLDSGGMGIGLVRQLASELEYQREDGRNILTITIS